jgi:hypothetical protein
MPSTKVNRLAKLKQRQAKIAEDIALQMVKARKARDRENYAIGALVTKRPRLAALDLEALDGLFIAADQDAALEKTLSRWRLLSRAEAAEAAKAREGIVLTFLNPVPLAARAALRAAGFGYNKITEHWEGVAELSAAETLAKEYGGELRRLKADPPSPQISEAAE